MALRYCERYLTTRAKLRDYLRRKLRERGWAGPHAPDPEALAERMAELRYCDDTAFAEAKARSLTRRGLGARRIGDALRAAGIDEEGRERLRPAMDAEAARTAVALARKRRIGPFAPVPAPDRAAREKWVGVLVRAGHAPALARALAGMAPGADIEDWLAEQDGATLW